MSIDPITPAEFAGHTPGDYQAKLNGVYWEVQGPDGWQIADTCASSAAAPEYGCSLALGEANAKLLAAAPRLRRTCLALQDEVARLREALEWLANAEVPIPSGVRGVARRALNPMEGS